MQERIEGGAQAPRGPGTGPGFDRLVLALGFALVLAAGLVAHQTELAQGFEQSVLDREFALLRDRRPQPVRKEVVLIGIDEASLDAFPEPPGLWHPHLGRFFAAMAEAQPAALGVNIVLPSHSFQQLIPGYDEKLIAGLAAIRDKVPLVLAQTVDEQGKFRKIFAPLVEAAGDDPLGSTAVCPDTDAVLRRFGAALCEDRGGHGLFATKIARSLGAAGPWQGWIDYAQGEAITYVPFHVVMQWVDRDPGKLRAAFRGKPVLLGNVLRYDDRLRAAVPLSAWEPARRRVPSVMLHAQVLRSMINGGLIRPAGQPLQWALLIAAALLWFGRDWLKAVALALFLAGAVALGLALLQKGVYLQLGAALLTAVLAYAARFVFEAVRGRREKRYLRDVFSSYVSPPIMKDILAGRIKPSLAGTRATVTILYADIRGFAARSQALQPEASIALLNEYFSEMTAAVYHCGGTVDKFMGDALMAIFGAPQALDCAGKNALESAQEMLVRLARLNARLAARGQEEVRIGIGLASGPVVLGHVGSHSRHEYTAIGEAVSAAAHLEKRSRELGYPVICNAAVAEAVGAAGGLADLGMHVVRGDARERLFGWNPPLLQAQPVVAPA